MQTSGRRFIDQKAAVAFCVEFHGQGHDVKGSTIIYSGRQHANEVSSTSHLMKLGEELVLDGKRREALKKVNVVLYPITNVDGADRNRPGKDLAAQYVASGVSCFAHIRCGLRPEQRVSNLPGIRDPTASLASVAP